VNPGGIGCALVKPASLLFCEELNWVNRAGGAGTD